MVDLMVFSEDTAESKVARDLIPYFEAVIEEVARHVPEKGYSYREKIWWGNPGKPAAEAAAKLGYKKAEDYWLETTVEDHEPNKGEALDAGAFLAFSWLHITGKMPSIYAAWESIKYTEVRK